MEWHLIDPGSLTSFENREQKQSRIKKNCSRNCFWLDWSWLLQYFITHLAIVSISIYPWKYDHNSNLIRLLSSSTVFISNFNKMIIQSFWTCVIILPGSPTDLWNFHGQLLYWQSRTSRYPCLYVFVDSIALPSLSQHYFPLVINHIVSLYIWRSSTTCPFDLRYYLED